MISEENFLNKTQKSTKNGSKDQFKYIKINLYIKRHKQNINKSHKWENMFAM